MSEPDTSFLVPHYQDVLKQASDQQAAAAGAAAAGGVAVAAAGKAAPPQQQQQQQREQQVEQVAGSIKELFVDYCKLAGLGGAKQRLPGLEAILRDSRADMQQVLGYMLGAAA